MIEINTFDLAALAILLMNLVFLKTEIFKINKNLSHKFKMIFIRRHNLIYIKVCILKINLQE